MELCSSSSSAKLVIRHAQGGMNLQQHPVHGEWEMSIELQ
jgi:hypothetical protein